MIERKRTLSIHRIHAHLDILQISERELARRAGLSHSTVNFLVHGTRRTCSATTAQAIETALCAEPGGLFGDIIPPPRSGTSRRGSKP